MFYDILERKNFFLGYKYNNELTHGFGPKMACFPIFFFGNIRQENVFYDILEQKKKAFLGDKNTNFKKSKN